MWFDNHFWTEFGNSGWVAGSALIAGVSLQRRFSQRTDSEYKPFIDAIFLMALAVCVNAAYWQVAREFAPEGLRHVPWMREYSAVQTMTTSILYIWGAAKYLKFIGNHHLKYELITLVGVLMGAFLMAWL